jgi:small subunit ribosomal protein S8
MLTDPIADLLTRIRNAARAQKETVTVPYSNVKVGILKVLHQKKFIQEFSVVEEGAFREIKIILNSEKREIHLRRISKPGQRLYSKTSNLKKIYGGLGVTVLSTSRGIMSGEEAKRLNIGGEILCEVY